jgi:hypothetical protein
VRKPFPHVVLDDFLPAEAAARLLDEFPPIDAFVSDGPEGGNKVGKYDSTLVTELSPFIRNLLAQLCCSPFVDFLESLSGVSGLVPIRTEPITLFATSCVAVASLFTPTSTRRSHWAWSDV